MAEETKAAAAPAAPPATTTEVVPDVVVAEKAATTTTTPAVVEETPAAADVSETEKPKEEEEGKISQSDSFKEESNIVADLEDPEKKALDELKTLIQTALINHEFTAPPPPPPAPVKEEEKPTTVEEVKENPTTVEETKVEETEVKVVETTPPPVAAAAPTPTSTPTPAPAPAPAPAVEKTETPAVVEKIVAAAPVVVDEDGAKTVEAIEETVVSIATKAPEGEASSASVVEEEKKTTEAAVVEEEEEAAAPPSPPEEIFIWGIPLLGDERSDVILLKFLRARDFKVKDAFTMIKNTVLWRKEFGIDGLLEEDLGTDLDKVVFMNGFDKEGHPVCYNVYGEFLNKELYTKIFCDGEKGDKFLRWRIQFLEKSIQKLDFSPGGISTIVQISDLKNSPGPFKRELRVATNQALSLLQDNYPEFVAKQIFINVPWWYLAFNRMISPFLTQRTKSKFVFAGPSKSAETLFKYIAPEQVPVQYGGLKKEGEQEFTTDDVAIEITIKPSSKQTVEFPVSETCLLVWELRVVGWEVSYGAEFVPEAEDGYTVIVSKTRKLTPTDEPVISSSFKIGEPGKIILTIDNQTSKKKKFLYRSKTKTSSD